MKRFKSIVDIIGIAALLELYIWRWQASAPHAWIAIAVWLTASFVIHRDTPKTLGWRVDNLWAATRRAGIVLGSYAAALIAIGLAHGAAARIPQNHSSLAHLGRYFAFCIFQEVVLNSLVTNRLLELRLRPWPAAAIAGTIFAAAHWPNPVLVPLTFIAGTTMAWLFARERNILPVAALQVILSLLVWWAFPIAWHHGLRVGPGYHTFIR
jgi:membrane protease YdiL (CAAX protease family)